MFPKKMLGLISWIAIAALMIPACGQTQPVAPDGREKSMQPGETGLVEASHDHGDEVQLTPVSLGIDEKLRVVATTNILADIVSQVGREAIELTQLLPLGADPHTYTATPQDVVAVANAHVVFANGANLEAEFLPKLIQDTGAPVVYVSQGIELREFGEEEHHDGEIGDGHKDSLEGVDPHTWTTPVNVIIFVNHIENALSALDPANTDSYRANARRYRTELEALDEWVKEQIATISADNRKLVTDHETFGYYADRYGLEQSGAVIPGFSTGAEPSARELAALEDAIREYGVRAVFAGTTINSSLAQQVAADTGIQLITLYTGSLGAAGSGVETYIDYVRYDTTAIVNGLR